MPRSFRAVSLAILFLAGLAGVARSAPEGLFTPLPPPSGVENAVLRTQYLREQSNAVDAWVDRNWESEYPRRHPSLSRAPQKAGEPLAAFKEREMKARMAVSELKGKMRAERKEWLAREWRNLLAAEIAAPLPMRLGPYDPDRAVYPLLLGFGWPSGVSVKLRIPERQSKDFAAAFPVSVPATFRVNEKGEIYLLKMEKAWRDVPADVFVTPPGPRQVWQGAHESWVTGVAFRPDGAQVVSTGADGVIACWDAESGNRIFRLENVEMAMSVAYAPDGSRFATGGADSFLRVRDGATGKEVWKSDGKGMIMAATYSPDGRFIATGDDGGFLRIWDAENGAEKKDIDLGSTVRAVDFTKGGRHLLAGGEGNFLVLWDLGTSRPVWRKELEWPVYAVAANPGGGMVAAGGAGDRLVVLREADGSESWSGRTEGEVRSVRFDPTGQLLAAGGAGYTAKVFPAAGGESLWSAQIGSPIRSLAFGGDGRKLFVGSADFGVRMFEVGEGDRVVLAFGAQGRIYVDRKKVETLFR